MRELAPAFRQPTLAEGAVEQQSCSDGERRSAGQRVVMKLGERQREQRKSDREPQHHERRKLAETSVVVDSAPFALAEQHADPEWRKARPRKEPVAQLPNVIAKRD